MPLGSVALVGAGPGHVDFLTLAALKAIQSADVILYDALISSGIRNLFPAPAKAIYVGKRCGIHALRQEQINELLIEQAKDGKQLVRLKGGDPLVFGRGAEELAALRAAGIPYRVIPGISAINGIAALHGLPLTDRHQSNEFRAIQGHHLPDDRCYWQSLASYQGTLVVLMGLENLTQIVERLCAFGAERQRPLAIVETDEDGQTHVTRGKLGLIQKNGFSRKTSGPGIIYIGANVELMDNAQTSPQPYPREESAHAFAFAHLS